MSFSGPLEGVRVLELSDGKAEMCGRLLADLGADVVLVEPPAGVATRGRPPLVAGASLYFATHNANKRSVVLDLNSAEGRDRFLQLADAADILIETTRPGTLEGLGLAIPVLHQRNPQLVALSISDFGQTGPYRDYVATNSVQIALAASLARSGLPGEHDPLLPPGQLAYETAAMQAAWGLIVAYWQRQHTGVGDHLDFSMFEGTAQILDPLLGATGSAAAGQSQSAMAVTRGRPDAGHMYPIFRCKDGYVRMCILNPRQWHGMRDWLALDADHEFMDPAFDTVFKRMQNGKRINALIAALMLTVTKKEAVTGGQRRGIPVAALATPSEVLTDEHFNARGAFTALELAPGVSGTVPSGFMDCDGERAGIRTPAPAPGQHTAEVLAQWLPRTPSAAFTAGSKRRPLSGLRVLDLGVIIAGAELGRLFADMGAEVIKVENRAFPDGARQSGTPHLVSFSFAQGGRGKLGLGLNLRSPKGVELFKQLAAKSDIILSNFKPGTLESLGIGYDVIKTVNPRIIMADSSALGSTGPLSRSMGYGPLVRASSGLTGLWCYPDIEGSFCDAITILPDHFAARVSAVGILALLMRRQRTGIGGTVSLSQAETLLTVLSTELLRESLQPGSVKPLGNSDEFHAPSGTFHCAGDDEWCVVAVRTEADWAGLCRVIGRTDLLNDPRLASSEGRVLHRSVVDAALTAWTSVRTPEEVMEQLQAAGVPAGKMFRLNELDHNPHLHSRHFFRTLHQPGHDEAWPTENAPVLSLNMPDPEIRPAPLQGEHTREIMARVLGLSASDIQRLIEAGDLEEPVQVR